MAELLKTLFNLSGRKRWLKTIDKEIDRYSKIIKSLSRQQRLIDMLLEEYKNKYGEDLRDTPKEKKDECKNADDE